MNPFLFGLVLVRAIGLYLVATAVVSLAVETFKVVQAAPAPPEMTGTYVRAYLYWLLYGGVGAVFVLRGTRFARLIARGTYPEGHCQRCGYDLSAAKLTQCPECGSPESGDAKGGA